MTIPPATPGQLVDLDTRRISGALTGWAQAALDRVLATMALAEQRWSVTTRAWLGAAGAEFPAGHVRLTLRAVAHQRAADPLKADDVELTEEHHAVLDLRELAGDLTDKASTARAAELVSGTLQTALGELAGVVAAPLRARLVRAGVLELPGSVADRCAGALCVGCRFPLCPRRLT